MSMFSRMLSAAVSASLVIAFAASAENAGACGHGPCGGYFGRPAGTMTVPSPAARFPGVNVYRGGQVRQRHHLDASPNSGVIVYGGGTSIYADALRFPHYIDNLEVVTVTRGAGMASRTVEAVCVARDGNEMPAARVRQAATLSAEVPSELLRCEAGLTLRALISSEQSGKASRHVTCASGSSLWSAQDGAVRCGAMRPLGITEAELRHRFGTGAIVLAGRSQADDASVVVTRGMGLTGGVGYAPY